MEKVTNETVDLFGPEFGDMDSYRVFKEYGGPVGLVEGVKYGDFEESASKIKVFIKGFTDFNNLGFEFHCSELFVSLKKVFKDPIRVLRSVVGEYNKKHTPGILDSVIDAIESRM